MEQSNVVLHAEKIDKIYPGTKALDDVSFDVYRGKVNVLIGENGAGKSTLMKIIAGIEQPSSGVLSMDGQKVQFHNMVDAEKHGIGIIHQELNLFPNLNVYQNIFMGKEKTKKGVLDNKTHAELAAKALARLEHPLDPNLSMGELRIGEQQIVEIARNVIRDNLKILIMDEPTSSLSNQEVQVLFDVMHDLTRQGISIVYISHRLEEIMQIGDCVTVLRDGKWVAHANVSDIDVPWIVQKMTGEGKGYASHDRGIDFNKQPTVLEVNDLTLPKKGGGYLLNHVNFTLRKGEILGIYGLMGAGRTEIFECIMGIRPEHEGEIRLNGEPMRIRNIAEQIDKGFYLLPEDRQRDGLVQTMDIGKNLALASLKKLTRFFFCHTKSEDDAVKKQISDIHIKVSDKKLPILSLSGGNQQKVVIGKGIMTDPQILLLDEPSRGIDIGAKVEVFDIIQKYADLGLSIIVVSSELNEIMAIADRIIVLSNGVKTDEVTKEEITEERLVLASNQGQRREAKENRV